MEIEISLKVRIPMTDSESADRLAKQLNTLALETVSGDVRVESTWTEVPGDRLAT